MDKAVVLMILLGILGGVCLLSWTVFGILNWMSRIRIVRKG